MSETIKRLKSIVHEVVGWKYFIPICLITAFIIRVSWVYFVDAQLTSDAIRYYKSGVEISAGKGYVANGAPTAYFPVGYPAFLGLIFAVFGPSVFIGKIANIILSMGILFFSYYISKRLFNSELVGRITLLVLSFYPNYIAYCSLLLSETLFLFLLLLGTMLLMEGKQGLWLNLAAGSVFGLTCLVKPQAIFLPAIFFGVSEIRNVWKKVFWKHLRLFVIVHISMIITILPWVVRNYKIYNKFVLISTNGGINLVIGNNPYATGKITGFNHEIRTMIDAPNEYEREMKAYTVALKYISKQPLGTIRLIPKKLGYLYLRDTDGVNTNIVGTSSVEDKMRRLLFLFKILSQFYYMVILMLFLLSIYVFFHKRRNKGRARPLPTLGLFIVIYFTFIYLVFFGDSRFHFPMIPWIVMYVGGLAELFVGRVSINGNSV